MCQRISSNQFCFNIISSFIERIIIQNIIICSLVLKKNYEGSELFQELQYIYLQVSAIQRKSDVKIIRILAATMMINALLYAPQLLEFILRRVNQILLLKNIVAAPLIHDHHQMRRTDHQLCFSLFLSKNFIFIFFLTIDVQFRLHALLLIPQDLIINDLWGTNLKHE